MAVQSRFRAHQRWSGRGLALCLCVLGFGLGVGTAALLRPLLGAALVLRGLAGPAPKSAPVPELFALRVGTEQVQARMYLPEHAPRRCLVVGHGVHYLGVNEPRLMRFSRALSQAGILVLTPELADLADYRLTGHGADVLAASVSHLAARCRHVADGRVGLLGFSFAGGLAVMSALRQEVQAQLAYVVSVGGYYDLQQVLTFLSTGQVATLHGPTPRKPHDYGILVLLYQYLDAFVPEPDRPLMRRAIRAWLAEDFATAWLQASLCGEPASERLFAQLTQGRIAELGPAILAEVRKRHLELAQLSPRGHFAQLNLPVYWLHGAHDTVIPPEEALFAARELDGRQHWTLVTPLIEHVELQGALAQFQFLKLLYFVAQLYG